MFSTSCGAASFIAAFAAGVNLETEQVDIRGHFTSSGKDFCVIINPKGNVPPLVGVSNYLFNCAGSSGLKHSTAIIIMEPFPILSNLEGE